MPNKIYLECAIEGYEDPFFLTVEIEGFDDPILALKKLGFFEKLLDGKVKIKGYEERPIRIRTEPRK